MAKTKQEFIAEGRASYNHPLRVRGTITDDTMPLFGLGDSWQAKAFAEGWRIEHHLAADRKRQEGAPAGTVQGLYAAPVDSAAAQRRAQRIDAMVVGYKEAALWSTTGKHPETGEELESLKKFDFSENAVKAIRVICETFYDLQRNDITAFVDILARRASHSEPSHAERMVQYVQVGHDLWLTTAGHGVGFRDHQGLGRVGDRLSAVCGHGARFEPVDLYLSDRLEVNLS